MRSKTLLIGVIGGIVIGVLLSAAVVFAGSLDPTAGPGDSASQMYTLEQIYQRLTTGNYFAKQSEFTEPATGPGSTMRTLDEIMAQAQPRALAKRVAKTGQTQCWDSAGTAILCAGTGQDGQYQAGINPAVAPTCCGTTNAYNTPAWTGVRFTDNGDGTVTDNLTALIWLKNTNCANAARDWATALTDVAQLNTNGTMNSNNCGDTSNGGSHQTDWRLPNVNELHSLIDLTHSNPALPAGHPFTGVQSDGYWTSTTSAGSTSNAWIVNLPSGYVYNFGKSNAHYVWPVRGGQ